MDTSTDTAGQLMAPVLADLATVVEGVTPAQFGDPTPCPDFDVATLRSHVIAWTTYLAAALEDPDAKTPRPDPKAFTAPDDPTEAAAVVRTSAASIASAVADGVADRSVLMVQSTMPGESILRMMLWEFLAHGSDLAKSTDQPWDPPEAAVTDSLAFAPNLLTDEYRGEGKDFGLVVPVPEDAPALDRLLGFSGRDPNWKP
jgi:uncharacterized protein (TIGR03086 family)